MPRAWGQEPPTPSDEPPAVAPQPAPPPAVERTDLPAFAAPVTPGRPVVDGPLSLEDAARLAIQHSPRTGSLRAGVAQAEAKTRGARAMGGPQLSVSGLGAVNTSAMATLLNSAPGVMPSAILSAPEKSSAGETLMFMLPLSTGGRVASTVRSARALEQAAGQQLQGQEQEVALQARLAYRRALLARDLLAIVEDQARAADERVRVSRERYAIGKVTLTDVLRNQSQHAAVLRQLAMAQRDAESALVELKATLGVSLSSKPRLTGDLSYSAPAATAEEAQKAALAQRAQIREADLRLQAAEQDVKAAGSSYRPQVYLTAMQSALAARVGGMNGAGVQVMASLPLVDSGQRRAQVGEAKAMLEAARQEREARVLDVAQEVAKAYLALQAAEVGVRTSQAAVSQAQEDYRLAQLRYEAGKALNLEVLDAQAAQTEALTNRAQALFDAASAADQLRRAMGVDLSR
ncbi:MAG TPA: TolC family protein [Armatimonadota bacterium]